MRLSLLPLLPLAVAGTLEKRCQPGRPNPDMQWGIVPYGPCWVYKSSCFSFVGVDQEVLIDEARGLVIWYGVASTCLDAIREEARRKAEGRPNWGWDDIYGPQIPVGNDTLVLPRMPADEFSWIRRLPRYEVKCNYSACPPFTPMQCTPPV